MDPASIAKKLLGSTPVDPNYLTQANHDIVKQIQGNQLKIIDLVQGLDAVLTNGNHEIRLRGVEMLTQILTSLDGKFLTEKEIEVLQSFLCLRLIDHKSMEQATLKCLSFFIDCKNKADSYNKRVLEFLKTQTNVQKMDTNSRALVYEITKKVLVESRQRTANINGDLIYSLIHIIEGESNPKNLLLCFAIISYVMKNFQNLEPYIDDLFEWLASYYPIDYTPSEKDKNEGVSILRSDLVAALYDCFFANELNAENVQTILLEKIDSNLISSKLESLECLIKCYEIFPLKSVKDYASSLWTSVRMGCLKKTVDQKLLETSMRALTALTTNLSEDLEIYFKFISDLYEELSIAFRKPEMGLFEAATRLMAHAVQPKLVGFNYILGKLLPISRRALADNELRPISSLAYIFEMLLTSHTGSKLDSDLNDHINELILGLLKLEALNEDCLRLLNATIRYKLELGTDTIDQLVDQLFHRLAKSSLDLEETLALICANYGRSDVIFDGRKMDCHIGNIIKLVDFYTLDKMALKEPSNHTIMIKFSIYLRLIILLLDSSQPADISDMNQEDLNEFLVQTRTIITAIDDGDKKAKLVEYTGMIHAIIVNKLNHELVQPILMNFFTSNYCQNLVPTNDGDLQLSCSVYLPVIKWTLKSLVLRNHQLCAPLINLVLNFVGSGKVNEQSALIGSRVFSFVYSNERPSFKFDTKQHYQVFALYKQKFYTQSSKEIRIRYNQENDIAKKNILICTLALQVPHLPSAVYRKDFEWLLRELIKILHVLNTKSNQDEDKSGKTLTTEELVFIIYECTDCLMSNDSSKNLLGLLGSLVDLNLIFASKAECLRLRRRALISLCSIVNSYQDSELLLFRGQVIDRLKACLADRKRLVRQAAAEARLRWVLVGQPVGST